MIPDTPNTSGRVPICRKYTFESAQPRAKPRIVVHHREGRPPCVDATNVVNAAGFNLMRQLTPGGRYQDRTRDSKPSQTDQQPSCAAQLAYEIERRDQAKHGDGQQRPAARSRHEGCCEGKEASQTVAKLKHILVS